MDHYDADDVDPVFNASDEALFEGVSFANASNTSTLCDLSTESGIFPPPSEDEADVDDPGLPNRAPRTSTPRKQSNTFKKPAPSKGFKCSKCNSYLKTIDGLNIHLKNHIWRG